MWEVLHLFSRYNQPIRIQATLDREDRVSAYASVSPDSNDMTIMLVNRALSQDTNVRVSIANFPATASTCNLLRLSNLPTTETFRSHAENALQEDTATFQDSVMNLTLPPLSVTAVLFWNHSEDDSTRLVADAVTRLLCARRVCCTHRSSIAESNKRNVSLVPAGKSGLSLALPPYPSNVIWFFA